MNLLLFPKQTEIGFFNVAKTAVLLFTGLIFLICPSVARPQTMSAAEVYEAVFSNIVVVKSFDTKGAESGLGSGVGISPELVITNCHVIEDAFLTVGAHRNAAILRQVEATCFKPLTHLCVEPSA